MIGMVCILTGVAPCDVHFAHGQVDHHGVDGFLAVERVQPFDVVIADRVRHVDVIFLNGLQALNGMLLVLV